MTKEQEKAIETMKRFVNNTIDTTVVTAKEMKEVLNLIQTQQNDIQRMQELLDLSDANNVKKDKIIDIQKQKLHGLKFNLKAIKTDLDFEPWSTYKVQGNRLFDMAIILEKEDRTMKKQITVYFEPVKLELEVDDKLDLEEREEEINRQVYDVQSEDIMNKTSISYWE